MKLSNEKAPEPVGAYPHSKRVGNLLFLSGVGPRKGNLKDIPGVNIDENGNVISHDIETQCHSVFENVKIILEESGSKWENLVDITVFLTDIDRDFEIYNKIYAANSHCNRIEMYSDHWLGEIYESSTPN